MSLETDEDSFDDLFCATHPTCEGACGKRVCVGVYEGSHADDRVCVAACAERAVLINDLGFCPACALKALDECDDRDFAESEAA